MTDKLKIVFVRRPTDDEFIQAMLDANKPGVSLRCLLVSLSVGLALWIMLFLGVLAWRVLR